MKVIIAVALLFAVAQAAPMLQDAESQLMFEGYIAKYGKTYASDAEKAKRLAIFKENVAMIDAHNEKHAAGLTGYTMGINQFTDMTAAEFKAYISRPFNRTTPLNVVELPTAGLDDSVDWRTKGAVTPVKNQGQCGSCWAFSTTGSTEGAVAIATGTLKSFSEQQLVDCSSAEGNQGCNGGLMDNGFKYIIKNGGIDSESDYPYTARDGSCNSAKAAKHVGAITSYQDVPQNNEDQLAAAVAKGPVSVAIEADQAGFQSYSGGVFDGNCGTQLDHGVLVVGYTSDYWIVKNSWGATWGDSGYIMMKRGVSASGICGIAMQPSYPIAGSAPPSPPSPPSPPTPPSPPSPPSQYDYEDPNPNGCHSGEEAVQIEGITGSFCSPSCSQSSPCPTNVPPGTTAQPQCALEKQGSPQPTNCALICHILSDAANHGCPEGSSCQHVQLLTGICTYAN